MPQGGVRLLPRAACQLLLFAASLTSAYVWASGLWQSEFEAGVRARASGNISESIDTLELAVARAGDAAARRRAQLQLGFSLAQAGRFAEADRILQAAREGAPPSQSASITLALGNVAAAEHAVDRAKAFYEAVLESASTGPADDDVKVLARLDMARLQPPRERLKAFEDLYLRIEEVGSRTYRARALLNLGQQASESVETARLLSSDAHTVAAPPGSSDAHATPLDRVLRLSYRSLSEAADLAEQSGNGPLRAQAFDVLAQLYENEERYVDAGRFNQRALALTQGLEPGQVEGLQMRLEWRAGRLQRRRGETAAALASYMRAAQHAESIRPDLPIVDETGQSTYQTVLKPLFASLLDLMLESADAPAAGREAARLSSALDVIELTHQAEMQDYLGDRCSVDAISKGATAPADHDLAVIYTIILKDRVEVVVRWTDGVEHHSIPISAAALEEQIAQFRGQLLDTSSNDYLTLAQKLYGWLIEPVAARLARSGVRELVFVPDGSLRLLPFAVLHDGHSYLVEHYAIATVTGLTMTATGGAARQRELSLLAGLAQPGPVVGKLADMGFSDSPVLSGSRGLPARSPIRDIAGSLGRDAAAQGDAALRSELALPGVTAEIQQIKALGRSVALLNDEFTVARFQREVASGRYQRIHIASHGFFGANAQDSFLLAFDNVIRMDDLQKLIADNGSQSGSIELLTLSACDTATGDDRAPLGFAGAAIKARARSVVGTLWAVSDAAARQLMQGFYAGLAHEGKAQALAQAQRALIHSDSFSHPYYWGPIMLIGDWN